MGCKHMDKIQVTRSSMPKLEDYIEEIKSLWDTHWLTNMGKKHQEFQEKVKTYLEVENIELLTNGHMALELSMQALKLEGEVITTPFTFASTIHAIVRNGLKPVFCDINEKDYTIDTDKIESLVTDRTCAILPVHVYGNICNVKKIDEIAKCYGLKVIYDAAHTFGETYDGKGVGVFGDASCFSFHATKVFNSIEGGAVCYSDKEFGEELYRLKNFGIRNEETVDGIGANAKMNEFCAAMGICNLRCVNEEIAKRKTIVERYRKHLFGINGIKLNPIQDGVKSNYAYFPIVIDEQIFGRSRNEIFEILKENDIIARKYFFPLANLFDCYKGMYLDNPTPVALHISKRVLTLPLYAELPLSDIDRICEIILKNASKQ